MERSTQHLACSFCGTATAPGRAVVTASPRGVAICTTCLDASGSLLATTPSDHVPSPVWVKERLDRRVIGQERAKRQLAVAVHTHFRRKLVTDDDVEIGKSNVLLVGPTGTGKTHLVRTLARLLDAPLHTADATALTEAGYVGEDVQSMIGGLIQAAGGDVRRAAQGILYIDEIDKLASKGGSPAAGRDVGGEGVQQALLRLVEGCEVDVNLPRARGRTRRVSFDTSQVLVICGGAFEGLDALVARRVGARGVGFGAGAASRSTRRSEAPGIRAEDLHAFGLIPELVGRLPVLAHLSPLSEEDLVRVLTEPKDALFRQYQRLLRMDGVSLRATRGALAAVARRCIEVGAGARSLRAVLEEVLLDVMFEAPSREDVEEIWITEDVVMAGATPLLGLRSETG
ncbi:MAG: ATP-dependent Clp protease ATP-binding subunit ClpX [Deltaproteobacteria bacterium]|nr:ATP-dependent Clp protease ATP-binding subunit ClpX [Deltaproteobacteria bacterium]